MRGSTARAAGVVIALLGAACAKQPPPAPPAPVRVENASMGIAIAELPAAFKVASNAGDTIVLVPAAVNDAARLTVSLGPLQPEGVNLVHWVEAQPAEFTGKPDGAFLGSKKLGTPIGTAYSARGRYRGAAGLVEETRILAIHPAASRLLMASYVYPAGEDVTARVQQLLDVFAQIEALPTPAGRG